MKIYHIIIPLLLFASFAGCDNYERKGEVTADITVNHKSLNMFVGQSIQLTASPTEASFTWSSEDPEIATVSANGLVELIGEGTTQITVQSGYATVNIPVISVVRVPITSVLLSNTNLEMTPGAKMMVTATVSPENANDVPLTYWESDNPKIVDVDYRGQVTAVSAGEAVITCRIGDFVETVSVYIASHLPFKGPHIISAGSPLELFFRDFDTGGEGNAFHDTGSGSTSSYRADNGDSNSNRVCVEGGGGIGYTEPGEWLVYTVEVQDAGDYKLEINLASPSGGGEFHFEVDGVDVTGSQIANPTGGWATFEYQDVSVPLTLSEGKHIIKFYIETSGYNIMAMMFTYQP